LQDNVDAIDRKEVMLDTAIKACAVKQESLDGLVMQNTELASRLARQAYEYNERERGVSQRVKDVEDAEFMMAQTLLEKSGELESEFEGIKAAFEIEKEEVMKEFRTEYQARLKTLADEFAFVEREKDAVRLEKEEVRQDRELVFDIRVAKGGGERVLELERINCGLTEEIKELNRRLSEQTSARNSAIQSPGLVSEKKDTSELMNVILSLSSYDSMNLTKQ
jgi:hypothetical protein